MWFCVWWLMTLVEYLITIRMWIESQEIELSYWLIKWVSSAYIILKVLIELLDWLIYDWRWLVRCWCEEEVRAYRWIYVYIQCLLWLCIYMLIVDLDVWYVVMNMLTHETNYDHLNIFKGMSSLKKNYV